MGHEFYFHLKLLLSTLGVPIVLVVVAVLAIEIRDRRTGRPGLRWIWVGVAWVIAIAMAVNLLLLDNPARTVLFLIVAIGGWQVGRILDQAATDGNRPNQD